MLKLERFHDNPIIFPREKNIWEKNGTFNPTAIKIGSKIYIIYRQISKNNISTFGLAKTSDGFQIDERLEYPIYFPRKSFEIHPEALKYVNFEEYLKFKKKLKKLNYRYFSGYFYYLENLKTEKNVFERIKNVSYFGVEDPRIVRIEDRLYLIYVAFNGVEPPRIAMSSIKVSDFVKEKFEKWEDPILISHPEIPDKSGVLFPEKINNKYVFLHRIFPWIWKDEVKDIEEFKNGRFLFGRPIIYPRYDSWDSRKIGPGPCPIKYKDKWILIYIAVSGWDEYYKNLNLSPRKFKINDGYRYKAGLMILDKNPEKIIYRSENPILEPETWYEKYPNAKPDVTYATGSVIHKNKLFVYYGSSDYFVSVGTLDLNRIKEILDNNDNKEVFRGSYSLSKSKKLLGIRFCLKSFGYKKRRKSYYVIPCYFSSFTKRYWSVY